MILYRLLTDALFKRPNKKNSIYNLTSDAKLSSSLFKRRGVHVISWIT